MRKRESEIRKKQRVGEAKAATSAEKRKKKEGAQPKENVGRRKRTQEYKRRK